MTPEQYKHQLTTHPLYEKLKAAEDMAACFTLNAQAIRRTIHLDIQKIKKAEQDE